MAFPTAVNSQITDSVPQSNATQPGEIPAETMENLSQTATEQRNEAPGDAINRTQENSTSQAATTEGITTLYSIDTASEGIAPGRTI